MGIFNKLYNNYVPLSDDVERKYYEIAYGLFSSAGSFNYSGIKKYVEFHLGQPCDEEKLKNALANFGPDGARTGFYSRCSDNYYKSLESVAGFTPHKISKLKEINKMLDQAETYRCTEEEAYDICYKDVLSNLNLEIEEMLKIVEENGVKFFREGIIKIKNKYEKIIGKRITEERIYKAIAKLYFDGNQIINKVLLSYLDYGLWKRRRETQIASVAIRAWHFTKSGKVKDGYISITDDECREFVMNHEGFMEKISEHPFEKEKYIQMYISDIKASDVYSSDEHFNVSAFWMPSNNFSEKYYIDTLCYHYWEDVYKKYEETEIESSNDIYDIIFHYISNSN